MTMYKCLTTDLQSWYDKKTQWTPNKWMPLIENKNNKEECGTGYHLGKTIENALRYSRLPCVIYTAQGKLKYGSGEDKKRYGKARILEDVTPHYILKANEFIQSIQSIKWFAKHKKPLKKWKLFKTRNAACDSARNSACNSAWNSARNSAWNSACDSACDATWNSVWNASWNSVWDSARDAALMAGITICDGLDIPQKHLQHAKDRWVVWERGYGLLCDVNGILYVYEKI